jgi:hypothetical protein
MQTEELTGPGGRHGESPRLWCYPLLRLLLLDDYSFPVKKNITTELFPISFLEWLTLEGTKMMCAAKKNPTKIWCKVSTECIKLKTFAKYKKLKKNHLETQINA